MSCDHLSKNGRYQEAHSWLRCIPSSGWIRGSIIASIEEDGFPTTSHQRSKHKKEFYRCRPIRIYRPILFYRHPKPQATTPTSNRDRSFNESQYSPSVTGSGGAEVHTSTDTTSGFASGFAASVSRLFRPDSSFHQQLPFQFSASTPQPTLSASSPESTSNKYRCHCGYTPSGEERWKASNLRRHKRTQHPTELRVHHCGYPGCKSVLTRSDNLRRHRRDKGHFLGYEGESFTGQGLRGMGMGDIERGSSSLLNPPPSLAENNRASYNPSNITWGPTAVLDGVKKTVVPTQPHPTVVWGPTNFIGRTKSPPMGAPGTRTSPYNILILMTRLHRLTDDYAQQIAPRENQQNYGVEDRPRKLPLALKQNVLLLTIARATGATSDHLLYGLNTSLLH